MKVQQDIVLIPGLAALAVLSVFASLFLGSVPIGWPDILSAIGMGGSDTTRLIIWDIRMPRALTALGVGMALGASGAVLQGLLRNPLAGPGVLGVSALSALGAVIAIYFNLTVLGLFTIPILAIVFALGATAVLFAAGASRLSTVSLILVGIGLSSLAGALTAFAMNLAPNPFSLSDMVNWLLGSVANRSFADIGLALPFWLVGAGLVTFSASGLRALGLGEETAASLGLHLGRTRLMAITGTALLTGASVSIAGTIGFVGIVAPHLIRPLVQHDPVRLILPSALLAGSVLVLADIAVRLLPFNQELKLGVAAALIGAPVFIWIAATYRGLSR